MWKKHAGNVLTGHLKTSWNVFYVYGFHKTFSVEQKAHSNLRWNDLNSVAWGSNYCKQLMLFISLLHSLNWFLLFTGCQKGHRAGGSHGETENEGWSEAGEQYIVRNSVHIVKSVTWRTVFSRPQRPNMWQWLDYLTLNHGMRVTTVLLPDVKTELSVSNMRRRNLI